MFTLLLVVILFRHSEAKQGTQDPIDATALTFTIEKGYYVIRVGKSSIRATTAAEMNRFVDIHLHEIDPEKTIVIGDPKAKGKALDPILNVLKKHDWIRFRLQDINVKPTSPPRSSKGETASQSI